MTNIDTSHDALRYYLLSPSVLITFDNLTMQVEEERKQKISNRSIKNEKISEAYRYRANSKEKIFTSFIRRGDKSTLIICYTRRNMTDLQANIGRNVHEVQKELEEQG